LNRYQLEQELGRGGMGVVYCAIDLPMQRRLAIKVMLAPAQATALERRFLDEARITGQLQHPGIAPVHEIGRIDDGRAFFAMKLIEGHTIAALLKARSSVSEDLPRFLAIFGQLCQTLAFVHSRGMLHRDLKPSNIMVGAFGEVQVMDWGLAKQLSIADCRLPIESIRRSTIDNQPPEKTQVGAILGTPAFMAPEQARGEIDRLDQRCDVFGLGAILSVILTGEPPYRGPDASAIVARAAAGDVQDCFARLDSCGADGELIVLARQCLAPAAADRLPDAGAVAEAMEAYQRGLQERLRQAEVKRAQAEVKTAEERKRRKLTVGLAAAVVAVLLAAALGVWWLEGERRERHRQAEQAQEGIEKGLAQVESLRDQARWNDARAALELTRNRLRADSTAELRQRVEEAGDLLGLVADLDRVRQDRIVIVNGKMNIRNTPAAYRKAFLDHGFDFLQHDEDDLVRRLRASPVKEALVTALDDWAVVETDPESLSQLGRLARLADPDEWRDPLRNDSLWKDAKALVEFAARVDVTRLTVPLAERLGNSLESKEGQGVELLQRMWRGRPQDFWLNYTLGGILQTARRHRAEEAVGCYRAARALRPDSAAVCNNLGLALYRTHQLDAAATALQSGLGIESNYAPILTHLGIIAHAKRDLKSAADWYERSIAANPGYSEAYLNLVIIFLESDRPADALAMAERAQAMIPKDARLISCRASALFALGKVEESFAEHRRAVKLEPKLEVIRSRYAEALRKSNNLEAAKAELLVAAELDPRSPDPHDGLGLVLSAQGDLEGAVAEYRKAVELAPYTPTILSHLGDVLARMRDYPAAIDAFRRCLALDPGFAPGWAKLGGCLKENGDSEKALEAYRKSIVADRSYVPAVVNMASLLVERGDLVEAAERCQSAIALDSRVPHPHAILGEILFKQGKFVDSLKSLRHAQSLVAPADPVHQNTLRLAATVERYANAEQDLAALDRGERPDLPASRQLAVAELCRRFRSRPYQAVRFFSSAFLTDPTLKDNFRAGNRILAARAAIAAGFGLDDAASVPIRDRVRLRQQALRWLHEELAAWDRNCASHPADWPQARRSLTNWQRDPAFSAIREAKPLMELIADEADAWRKFWHDVAKVLGKL
jgi:tetratricopeptide (TPR) repeat protein